LIWLDRASIALSNYTVFILLILHLVRNLDKNPKRSETQLLYAYISVKIRSIMSNNLERKNLEYYVAIVTIRGIDWQEIVLWTRCIKMQTSIDKILGVYFLLATKNESPSRYCFRSILWFSNRVLCFQTSFKSQKLSRFSYIGNH
jgi:hypothetical protein